MLTEQGCAVQQRTILQALLDELENRANLLSTTTDAIYRSVNRINSEEAPRNGCEARPRQEPFDFVQKVYLLIEHIDESILTLSESCGKLERTV